VDSFGGDLCGDHLEDVLPKFEISPEKVDDKLGSSALLAVSRDDGAVMMIDGLVPKKYSASSGDDQALSLEGQSRGEPTS
jgi:hypothetical protein